MSEKISAGVVKIEFYVSTETFWGKLKIKNRTVSEKFLAGLPKTEFTCPEEHLAENIRKNNILKFFGLKAKNFGKVVKTAFYVSGEHFLSK